MFALFVAGGIASGKSTVAQAMCDLGARRLDLDQLSREVLQPGSDVLDDIAREFGRDLVDADGVLDRQELARRAFATPEGAARLEAIEMPAIVARMEQVLGYESCVGVDDGVVVVEVPLLDRIEDHLDLANEVIAVVAPLDARRERAVERGMDADDFDARVANQPSDAWVCDHAGEVFVNDGGPEDLRELTRAWWARHVGEGDGEASADVR